MYQRNMYVLLCEGECLLLLDCESCPPFQAGELLVLDDEEGTRPPRHYRVIDIARRIPYRITEHSPLPALPVALAGQEIGVQLQQVPVPEEPTP